MAKRKSKPAPQDATAPAASEFLSDAEAHAAAIATDPAAFEFPFGAAGGTPAGDPDARPKPATDAAYRPDHESIEADGRHTFTSAAEALGDKAFPTSELPPKPPASNDGTRPDAAGTGKAWNPVFGLRGDFEAGVRLLEDRRFKQMQIRFDAKPSDAVREAMRDSGFQWRQAEQVWTKRIDPEHAWRTRAEAEALFGRVAALIREERGLAPTRDAGPQAG